MEQRLIDADALKQMIDFRMWDVDDDYPHDEASNRISEDHAVKKIIDEMPTIGTEPQWIPVSERLPETYGEYIVTRKTEYGIKTKTSLYYENGIWWPPEEVIAWMPLPEPYKAE